jgi:hypothetical protein
MHCGLICRSWASIVGTGTAKVAGLVEIVRDEMDARLPEFARFAVSAIADQRRWRGRSIGSGG